MPLLYLGAEDIPLNHTRHSIKIRQERLVAKKLRLMIYIS